MRIYFDKSEEDYDAMARGYNNDPISILNADLGGYGLLGCIRDSHLITEEKRRLHRIILVNGGAFYREGDYLGCTSEIRHCRLYL